MKISQGLALVLALTANGFLGAHALAADSDLLAKTSITINSTDSEAVLNRTIANPKAVFEHYVPALDSNSTLVKPLEVTGTASRPILKMSVQKCVAIICKTVDLDAEMNLKENKGSCDRNLRLEADLSRSSDTLTEVYDQLNVEICYMKSKLGKGKLLITGSAHHSPTYSQGMIQQQIFSMLQLQIEPMTKALDTSMNGTH